jgi:hypothetical protein
MDPVHTHSSSFFKIIIMISCLRLGFSSGFFPRQVALPEFYMPFCPIRIQINENQIIVFDLIIPVLLG